MRAPAEEFDVVASTRLLPAEPQWTKVPAWLCWRMACHCRAAVNWDESPIQSRLVLVLGVGNTGVILSTLDNFSRAYRPGRRGGRRSTATPPSTGYTCAPQTHRIDLRYRAAPQQGHQRARLPRGRTCYGI